MIVHECLQGSEAWEQLRRGKATASMFGRIVTPAKLQFAAGAGTYACEVVAEQLGVASEKPMPTYWMDRGVEMEPYARKDFELMTNLPVREVGFIELVANPVGCSPDGLVGDDAMLEIKCPSSEVLIGYHYYDVLPREHVIQVQAQMWIAGRHRCHFFAWHPDLKPFHVVVTRDPKFMNAFDSAIPKFLALVESIKSKVTVNQRFDWAGVNGD